MCSTLNVALERKVIWFIFIFVVGVVFGVVGHMCEFVVWMLCTYWRASLSPSLSDSECHCDRKWHRNRQRVRVQETHLRISATKWSGNLLMRYLDRDCIEQEKKTEKKSKTSRFEYISMFYGSLQFHWNNKRSGRTLWQRTSSTTSILFSFDLSRHIKPWDAGSSLAHCSFMRIERYIVAALNIF